MIQTIKRPPTALGLFGAGLGQGISQGLQSYYEQKADERKQAQRLSVLEQAGLIPGKGAPMTEGLETATAPDQGGQFSPAVPKSQVEELPYEQRVQAATLAGVLNPQEAQALLKAHEAPTKAQQKLESENEPHILASQNSVKTLTANNLRFNKLDQLSDSANFPPRLLTALFTNKEGELHPVVQAGLSEDAQEFQKLIADMINGAKDTFGARVTNFDVKKYLQRLPSFLNSAEGRKRIIEDLRIINELNLLEEQGALDEMRKANGKIRWSTARDRASVTNKAAIEELTKRFLAKPEAKKTGPEKSQKTVRMTKDGKQYDIPADKAMQAQKEGFKKA